MAAAEAAIGTLREKPLHAAVKGWYARTGDRAEVPVDGYVIDLVRGGLLIEIQTRGFSGMRTKVATLLAHGHRVRIVHPIAAERWIVKLDDGGSVVDRRRSPRHGSLVDLAPELVSFPALLRHPGLEVEVLLTVEEELRQRIPGRCWRRRGWTVVERRLLRVVGGAVFAGSDDLVRLLPADLPQPFTTADLADRLARPRRAAQQLAYCLREAGVIDAVGMRQRAIEYRVAGVPTTVPAAAREGGTAPPPER